MENNNQDLDSKIRDKKAEAWDTSVFIQASQVEFQKFIAPHDAKLNKLISEINQLSVEKKQSEETPNVQTSENKIIVSSNQPKEKL
jgi:hypothetical protein